MERSCRSTWLPTRVNRGCVGLEVTELLLLLGIQPPLTTSFFWRLVKAAFLVWHKSSPSQTGWHTEPFGMKRLLLLMALILPTPALASVNPAGSKLETYTEVFGKKGFIRHEGVFAATALNSSSFPDLKKRITVQSPVH